MRSRNIKTIKIKNSWIMTTSPLMDISVDHRKVSSILTRETSLFHWAFWIRNVRKGRILISCQNTRSKIKVTSKELCSIQTGWSRFQILLPGSSSDYNFIHDMSIQFPVISMIRQSLLSSMSITTNTRRKSHPPYLSWKKPNRVEQSMTTRKNPWGKNTQPSSYSKELHDSMIRWLIRILCATEIMDKTWSKIE